MPTFQVIPELSREGVALSTQQQTYSCLPPVYPALQSLFNNLTVHIFTLIKMIGAGGWGDGPMGEGLI